MGGLIQFCCKQKKEYMAEKEEQTGREDTNKTSWGKTIKKGTSEQTASGLHLKEKEVLPAASEAEGQDRENKGVQASKRTYYEGVIGFNSLQNRHPY